MSWSGLRDAFYALDAAGHDGFEGAVAALMSEALGQPFVVAQSGSQPTGDARSSDGSIAIQSKRYKPTTAFNINNIDGDLREISRRPSTEVLLLVATRSIPDQLVDRLEVVSKETGCDIFALELLQTQSDFAALAILHSSALASFPSLNGWFRANSAWVSGKAADPAVREAADRLRSEIMTRMRTYSWVQKQALARLKVRFKGASLRSDSNDIDLDSAIPRPSTVAPVIQHWRRDHRVIRIEGQEGTGKSWVAARSALDIAREGVLVFWFDSADWGHCRSIEKLIEAGLSLSSQELQEVKDRLSRKALGRWTKPILLVLDGVNERECLESANSILRDMDDRYRNIRMLLTTRPLEPYPHYEGRVWQGQAVIPIEGFTDDELRIALQRHGIAYDEVGALEGVIRFPRYFRTWLRLRSELPADAHITPALLLWYELIRKIREGDPQLRRRLEWTRPEDFERFVQEHMNGVATTGSVFVRPAAARLREDLMELGVVEIDNRARSKFTPQLIRLGYAFYLKQVALDEGSRADATPFHVSEKLRLALEPGRGSDDLTEALHHALMLACADLHISGTAKAGLLHAWWRSHNAFELVARLRFWEEYQPAVYCRFIEAAFRDLYHADVQTALVEPLARRWLRGDAPDRDLQSLMEKWLTLLWHDRLPPGTDEVQVGDLRLPVAQNEQQVRLSAVAVSLLSLRPVRELLPALARARATLDESSKDFPGGRRIPLKDLHTNIGALMRWGYGEGVAEELLRLFNSSNSYVERKGFQLLSGHLKLHAIPPELAIPIEDHPLPWKVVQARDRLRSGDSIFVAEAGTSINGEIASLAIRDDLPPPSEDDKASIKNAVELIAARGQVQSGRSTTRDDLDLDRLWPWFCRLYPEAIPKVVETLAAGLSQTPVPQIRLRALCDLATAHCTDGAQTIERALRVAWDSASPPPTEYLASLYLYNVLLHCGNDDCEAWLALLEGDEVAVSFLPLPTLLPMRLGNSVRERYKLEVEKDLPADTSGVLHPDIQKRLRYHLRLLAFFCQEDPEMYVWSERLLPLFSRGGEEARWSLQRIMAISDPERFWRSQLSPRTTAQLPLTQMTRLEFLPSLIRLVKEGRIPIAMLESAPSVIRDVSADAMTEYGKDAKVPLSRWGMAVMRLALCLVSRSEPKFDQSSMGSLSLSLDKEGRALVLTSAPHIQSVASATPATWGVDYGGPEDLRGQLESNSDSHRFAEQAKLAADVASIREWNGFPVRDFYGHATLLRWGLWNPERIRECGIRYCEAIERNPRHHFEMGVFTDAVLCALLPHEPKLARDTWSRLSGAPFRFNVWDSYGCALFLSTLMDLDICKTNEHWDITKSVLSEARSDEDIMYIVLAAVTKGSAQRLADYASGELCGSTLARERCLGISVLAWLPEHAGRLQLIYENDSSLWVREHAAWAREVALQEASCRRRYESALSSHSLSEVTVALQVMRPALTPHARWWHVEIEERLRIWAVETPAKLQVVLYSFWYQADKTTSASVKVCDRNLKEFCRGEKLVSRVHERMAPWWRPSRS